MNTKKIPKLIFLLSILLIASCSKTEDNVPLSASTAEITVDKIVREASLRNQEIPFKIVTEAGNDVTDVATFYIDGNEIIGNVFSSPTVGEFEVYGVYDDAGVETTTNTVGFRVIIPERKVVIEDYTGTWCVWCPRVTAALVDVHEATDKVSVVAIHESGSGEYADPMHFPQIQDLKDEFGVEGLPAAQINRTTSWSLPTIHNDSHIEEVTSIAGAVTNLGIGVNSQLIGSELIVEVNLAYEEGSGQNDKLVVYLVENGIVYLQKNAYNTIDQSIYFGLGDPIPDFVHNDVLRASLSNVFGDVMPSIGALEEYTRTYNFNVPAEYNKENLSIVVMVVDENNTAKNSQFADVNEDKSYE